MRYTILILMLLGSVAFAKDKANKAEAAKPDAAKEETKRQPAQVNLVGFKCLPARDYSEALQMAMACNGYQMSNGYSFQYCCPDGGGGMGTGVGGR